MTEITRRSFLITSASAIGSCFVPGWLLRRAADYAKTDGGIYIEAPESARNTLYAIEQSRDCFQLALNGRTDTLPPPITWREYFQDNTEVDPDDHLDVRKWLREEGSYYFKGEELRHAYRHLDFLDNDVDYGIWENYLAQRVLSNLQSPNDVYRTGFILLPTADFATFGVEAAYPGCRKSP